MKDDQWNQIEFDNAVQAPVSWFAIAHNLKWSADQICWLDKDHNQIKEDENSFRIFSIPMYRMLMGLSFENILKGLMIAQGLNVLEDGKLRESFATHSISHLLDQIDTKPLNLTKEERKILLELERYVLWQGRYPIPKESVKYVRYSHGNHDHRIEQELWDRLFNYLQDVGWKLGHDGEKIPLRKKHEQRT